MTFLERGGIRLSPLTLQHVTPEYLSWINGEMERRYRGPKAFPSIIEEVQHYVINSKRSDHLVCAIETTLGLHIGNISLNPINWVHGNAELSILIGSKHQRRGFGRAAIRALSEHSFNSMGLKRLWAESPNPAFTKMMIDLGWTQEGIKREAFLLDGLHTNIYCWGLLASEFRAQTREGNQGVVPQNPSKPVFRQIEGGKLS